MLTILLTSCNGVGLGVGVVVSGDTIANGASWLGSNIGSILLVILALIAIVLIIAFIGSAIESADKKEKAKQILKKEEEKKAALEEMQNSTQIAKKLAEECIQSGIRNLEYNSKRINNIQEKTDFFIRRYQEDGRPRGISITMYSALHCEKSSDFYTWLFDDSALTIAKPENLDKNHLILFNAFKIIVEDQNKK